MHFCFRLSSSVWLEIGQAVTQSKGLRHLSLGCHAAKEAALGLHCGGLPGAEVSRARATTVVCRLRSVPYAVHG